MAINRARHGRMKFAPPPPDQPPSEAQVELFLTTYAETFSEYEARKVSMIGRPAMARLKEDPAFLERWAQVLTEDDIDDRIEAMALHKAIVVGDKDLLTMLLKARKPEKYGAKASLNLNVDVTKLTTEELDELIAKHGKRS